METCPSCGSPRLYPSRTRSTFERIRRVFSRKRPYRCHACDWRRWIDVPPAAWLSDTAPYELRTEHDPKQPLAKTDLDSLDPREPS